MPYLLMTYIICTLYMCKCTATDYSSRQERFAPGASNLRVDDPFDIQVSRSVVKVIPILIYIVLDKGV